MKKLHCELTAFEVQAIKIMSFMMYKRLLDNKTENDDEDKKQVRYGLFDLYAKMADAEEFMKKGGTE